MSTIIQQLPKVQYYPNREDGRHFKGLSSQDTNEGLLPNGFPSEDINSVEEALKHSQGLGLVNPSEISRETFPLPDEFALRLAHVSEQCYSGIGFCVLRGLDPDKYSEDENVLIFAGISFYIAPQRGFQDQNKSQVVCHIKQKATGETALTTKATPVFTNGAMVFHTDGGDLLSLYSVEVDKAGRGQIASSWQAYNELARARPDIVRELAQPWIMDTFSDYSKHPPRTIPFLSFKDDKMIVFCSRYHFNGFGANKRNPALSLLIPAQIEALNALHFVAEKISITLDSRKGDILYLNNMSCFYGREAFAVPAAEATGATEVKMSPRHRIRLFLRDPARAWKLPAEVERLWEDIYGEGIVHSQKDELWKLDEEGQKDNVWQFNG